MNNYTVPMRKWLYIMLWTIALCFEAIARRVVIFLKSWGTFPGEIKDIHKIVIWRWEYKENEERMRKEIVGKKR